MAHPVGRLGTASEMSLGPDEYALQWAEIKRLPTVDRFTTSLFDKNNANEHKSGMKVIDVTKLKPPEHHVDVRYKNLSLEAECEAVHGKPLPTVTGEVSYNGYKLNEFVPQKTAADVTSVQESVDSFLSLL
ncbi:hypothetical protein Patl1_23933 [Pistacia atlantica]|uniref:Uncharacterized protein n=1 Tax=Pistacia atlantica TaxID=434234 RepID=A0ACC1A195_9ROSI|nr:hypothetical protein Patl1_23933 [Pistacia atlantica]